MRCLPILSGTTYDPFTLLKILAAVIRSERRTGQICGGMRGREGKGQSGAWGGKGGRDGADVRRSGGAYKEVGKRLSRLPKNYPLTTQANTGTKKERDCSHPTKISITKQTVKSARFSKWKFSCKSTLYLSKKKKKLENIISRMPSLRIILCNLDG